MTDINWYDMSAQVAATLTTGLLSGIEPHERIWIAYDNADLFSKLSSGERATLSVARLLNDIGRTICHLDADLRQQVCDIITSFVSAAQPPA